MGSNTGCDRLFLERSEQHAPSSQPGTEGVPGPGQHRRASTEPARSPAAPRCPRRIPAGSGHRDAVPIPGRCQPRARRGQLPGGLCNPVCSNLAISGRESRAQRRLTPGLAVGGAGPEGRSPWQRRGARAPGALGSPAPVPRGSAKPREGAAWGGSAVTAVLAALSIRRTGAPAAAPKNPGTKRPCRRLPSHGLWLLLSCKRELGRHKARLCCPGRCPCSSGPSQGTMGRRGKLPGCPGNATALETTQAGTDRNDILFLSP